MSTEPDFNENLRIEELSITPKDEKPLKVRAGKTARNSGKLSRRPIKAQTPEEKAEQAIQSALRLEQYEKEHMEKHLEKLKKDQSQAEDLLEKVTRLGSEFPDLRVDTDRWKTTRYKAKSANPRVTHVEFRRTCGCCPDAGILAMPYMETTLGRVYSDPHHMEIGEGRSYDWVRESHGWEAKYRKTGIPERIIQKIRVYLDAELKNSIDGDDEEDED